MQTHAPAAEERQHALGRSWKEGGSFSLEVVGSAWGQGQGLYFSGVPDGQELLRTKKSWPADGAAGIQTETASPKTALGRLGFTNPCNHELFEKS